MALRPGACGQNTEIYLGRVNRRNLSVPIENVPGLGVRNKRTVPSLFQERVAERKEGASEEITRLVQAGGKLCGQRQMRRPPEIRDPDL